MMKDLHKYRLVSQRGRQIVSRYLDMPAPLTEELQQQLLAELDDVIDSRVERLEELANLIAELRGSEDPPG